MIVIQEEEKRRNSLGLDILCIHKSHPLSTKIFSFWERNKDNPKVSRAKVKRKINAEVRCVIIMAKGLSRCTFFVFALQMAKGLSSCTFLQFRMASCFIYHAVLMVV